jgi:hypothetical protein
VPQKKLDDHDGTVVMIPTWMRHRGPDSGPPEYQPYVNARRYRGVALEKAIARGEFADYGPAALLIVHMQGEDWASSTLKAQSAVVSRAVAAGMPVLAAFVGEPSGPERLPSSLRKAARNAAIEFRQPFGTTALIATRQHGGAQQSVRDYFRTARTRLVIVIGQTCSLCVQSTIFGLYFHNPPRYQYDPDTSRYSEGLLDLRIKVATSRRVIAPYTGPRDDPGPYYVLKMHDSAEVPEMTRYISPLQGIAEASATFAATQFAAVQPRDEEDAGYDADEEDG